MHEPPSGYMTRMPNQRNFTVKIRYGCRLCNEFKPSSRNFNAERHVWVQHMREHYPEYARSLYEPYQFKHYVKDYVEVVRVDDPMDVEEPAPAVPTQAQERAARLRWVDMTDHMRGARGEMPPGPRYGSAHMGGCVDGFGDPIYDNRGIGAHGGYVTSGQELWPRQQAIAPMPPPHGSHHPGRRPSYGDVHDRVLLSQRDASMMEAQPQPTYALDDRFYGAPAWRGDAVDRHAQGIHSPSMPEGFPDHHGTPRGMPLRDDKFPLHKSESMPVLQRRASPPAAMIPRHTGLPGGHAAQHPRQQQYYRHDNHGVAVPHRGPHISPAAYAHDPQQQPSPQSLRDQRYERGGGAAMPPYRSPRGEPSGLPGGHAPMVYSPSTESLRVRGQQQADYGSLGDAAVSRRASYDGSRNPTLQQPVRVRMGPVAWAGGEDVGMPVDQQMASRTPRQQAPAPSLAQACSPVVMVAPGVPSPPQIHGVRPGAHASPHHTPRGDFGATDSGRLRGFPASAGAEFPQRRSSRMSTASGSMVHPMSRNSSGEPGSAGSTSNQDSAGVSGDGQDASPLHPYAQPRHPLSDTESAYASSSARVVGAGGPRGSYGQRPAPYPRVASSSREALGPMTAMGDPHALQQEQPQPGEHLLVQRLASGASMSSPAPRFAPSSPSHGSRHIMAPGQLHGDGAASTMIVDRSSMGPTGDGQPPDERRGQQRQRHQAHDLETADGDGAAATLSPRHHHDRQQQAGRRWDGHAAASDPSTATHGSSDQARAHAGHGRAHAMAEDRSMGEDSGYPPASADDTARRGSDASRSSQGQSGVGPSAALSTPPSSSARSSGLEHAGSSSSRFPHGGSSRAHHHHQPGAQLGAAVPQERSSKPHSPSGQQQQEDGSARYHGSPTSRLAAAAGNERARGVSPLQRSPTPPSLAAAAASGSPRETAGADDPGAGAGTADE